QSCTKGRSPSEGGSVDYTADAIPADAGLRAARPPHEHRFALHVARRHATPDAAVGGVVAVVAHDEDKARLHDAFSGSLRAIVRALEARERAAGGEREA